MTKSGIFGEEKKKQWFPAEDDINEDALAASLLQGLSQTKSMWNNYVQNAKAVGIDVSSFCNTECANSCFADVSLKAVPVSSLLTSCLIKECHCFKPAVPEIKYAALTDFMTLVEEAEQEVEQEEQDEVDSLRQLIAAAVKEALAEERKAQAAAKTAVENVVEAAPEVAPAAEEVVETAEAAVEGGVETAESVVESGVDTAKEEVDDAVARAGNIIAQAGGDVEVATEEAEGEAESVVE